MNDNYEELMYIDGQWERIGGSAEVSASSSESGFGLPIKTTVKDEYLVEYEYDTLDWKVGRECSEAFTTPGACTVVVDREGVMHRNFDWKYDNSKTGIITTKGIKHNVIGCVNIREDIELTNDMLRAMPFAIVDGVNDAGLQVAVLVIPKQEHSGDIMPDFNPSTTMTAYDTIPTNMVVRYILENCSNVKEAISICDHVCIKESSKLSAMGYGVHWIVSKEGNTCILEPNTYYDTTEGWRTNLALSACAKYVSGVWENRMRPVLTNFRVGDTRIFNSDWTVGTPADNNVSAYMEPQSAGLERYNNAVNSLDTDDVIQLPPYTNCYINPTEYCSDFVDANHDLSTIKSFVEDHEDDIKAIFNNRTRNGETWQTVHYIETFYRGEGIGTYLYLVAYQEQQNDSANAYFVSESLVTTLCNRESFVESVLDNKVNFTIFNTRLASKADTADVYTALANAGLQYEVKGEI